MELVTRATHGRPVESNPRKGELPETFPRGRHCKAKRDCNGKELSRYNAGPDCHACTQADREAAEQKAHRQIAEAGAGVSEGHKCARCGASVLAAGSANWEVLCARCTQKHLKQIAEGSR
jgi:DNA-directed RNA polymerase subunit RPC12/RpoP